MPKAKITFVALSITGIIVLVCIAFWASLYGTVPDEKTQAQFRLSFVPEGLNVSTVLYANEKSWGLPSFPMPGDNETGVIAYELTDSAVSDIKGAGIEFLHRLPPKAGDPKDWRGRYDGWRDTPVSDQAWLKDAVSGTASANPRLRNFLNKYGFEISVDSEIERLVDDAIAKPGSYYANGRAGGTLIVIPEKRRVVYVYAG